MLSWEKGLQAGRKGGRKVFHGALLSTGTSYATFRGYIYTTLKLEKLQENCCGSGAASDETAPQLGLPSHRQMIHSIRREAKQ